MNAQQIGIILILVACVALILAQGILDWSGVDFRGAMQTSIGEPRHFEAFDRESSPLARSLAALLTQFISGLLLLYLFTAYIANMSAALRAPAAQQLRIVLLGLIAMALFATLMFSAAMSVSTFPLTFLLGGTLFTAVYTGYVVVAYALGRRLLQAGNWTGLSPAYALLAGLLVVHGAGAIPYLGLVIKTVAAGAGLGIVIATRFGTGKAWSLALLSEG